MRWVLKPEYNILTVARCSKGFRHKKETIRLLRNLNRIRSDAKKLKISINNSKSKTVVITTIESGYTDEFSSVVKASKYLGISPTHFKYYVVKQQIKGIYLAVKIADIAVTADYTINKLPF